MIFIYGFLVKKGLHIDFEGVFTNFSLLWRLLFMGIISGVLAFYLYYEGMKHLPVGVVTFIELSYPFLGTLMLGLTTNGISSIQIIAAIMLVVSISLLLGLELRD
jgi:drug/metabolite transporter (DMT)-like permease